MKIVKNFWTLKIQHFRFAHFQNRLGNLNPYPWNFGNITERVFFKKSKIITCGVTVGTNEMKILCGNRVSVRLYCDVNFKWHMPMCAEICRAEQKICAIFGTERVFRKKNSKARKHIQNAATLRSWFFPENALGDGRGFWIFFSGFTDKG